MKILIFQSFFTLQKFESNKTHDVIPLKELVDILNEDYEENQDKIMYQTQLQYVLQIISEELVDDSQVKKVVNE